MHDWHRFRVFTHAPCTALVAMVSRCALLLKRSKTTGTELSLAIGFSLTLFRLGSVFSNILSPLLATSPDYYSDIEAALSTEKKGAIVVIWLGILICLFCLGLACISWMIETECIHPSYEFLRSNESSRSLVKWFVGPVTSTHAFLVKERQNPVMMNPNRSSLYYGSLGYKFLLPLGDPIAHQSTYSAHTSRSQSSASFTTLATSNQLFDRNSYQICIQPLESRPQSISSLSDDDTQSSEPFYLLTSVSSLPLDFWILSFTGMCLYISILPFVYFISEKSQRVMGVNSNLAGWIMSIPDLVSCLLVPLVGRPIRKSPQKVGWMALCGLGVCGMHVGLERDATLFGQCIHLVGLGVFYAIMCSVCD